MMKKLERVLENKKILCVFSFLMTIIVLLISMAIDGMFPFGNISVLKWDLEIQYIDLYAWFRNILHNGEGILYSFSKSLGGNVYGLFSSYLANPLNLLIYFFRVEDIPIFLLLMTILKLSLAAITMCLFITKRFMLKNKILVLICSVAYALFEYNIAFCSNLHFLDSVYILPLAALGVWQFVNLKKRALLYISITYVIICNWYTGYMVCLFTILDFFFEYYLSGRGKKAKEFFITGLQYIGTMVLAVLSSCVFFLPSVMASMNGKGVLSFDKLTPDFHIDPLYPLRALFVTAPTNQEHGMPAIYISYLVVVICLLFLMNKKINRRLKRAVAIFLFLVFISFSYVPFEIMWTDFKETFSFHHRYAFVFGLLMVMTVCFYFCEWERNHRIFSLSQLFGAGAILGGWFVLQNLVIELGTAKQICFTLFLIGVYLVLFVSYLYSHSRLRTIAGIFLICFFMFEQTYNVANAFEGYTITVSEYKNYAKKMGGVVERIKNSETNSFYRVEKTFSEMSERRENREPAASEAFVYDYRGVTHYSSLYDGTVNDFLVKLGYCKQDAMASNYVDTNFLADSLLGIKYVISDKEQSVLEKVSDYPEEKNKAVYKNSYALGFGTRCLGDIDEFEWGATPFESAQNILNSLLGEDNNYFTTLEADLTEEEEVSWDIEVTQSGPVYVYFNNGHQDVDIYINGEFRQTYFGRFYKNVIYMGSYKEGDIVHLKLKDTYDRGYDYQLTAVSLKEQLVKDKLSVAKVGTFDPDVVRGGHVKGLYEAEEETNMLLQVPYDTGWEIIVNGEEVSYKEAFNGLIEIRLPKGKCEIEMNYYSPGLKIGVICTCLGIGGFCVWPRQKLRKISFFGRFYGVISKKKRT